MTLLKAHSAAVGQARTLRREPAPPTEPRESGRWITEAALAELLQRHHALGREEGLVQGRENALASARKEAQQQAQAQLEQELKTRQDKQAKEQAEKWRGLATALAQQVQGLRDQLEAELTEWTFLAVTRLLGERPHEQLAASVRQVLDDAQLHEPLTVLLHVQDLPLIDPADEAWPSEIRFAADERIKVGGCLVQSAHQTLDARLDVQLTLLREALDAARRER